jgi:uncharacterized protein
MKSSLLKVLIASSLGSLFGAGLVISGMSNAANVLNFLDLAAIRQGRWDARLAFVMGGAVLITSVGFVWLRRRQAPYFERQFSWPTLTSVDWRLAAGAALFGIGWGLVGYCPGPAFVNIGVALGSGSREMLSFIPALFVGMWAAGKVGVSPRA